MYRRTVLGAALRATLAWLFVFALLYRALGSWRWVWALGAACLVVAVLGGRGLLRPLGPVAAPLAAAAVSTGLAALLLLVGFQLLPSELPGLLQGGRSPLLHMETELSPVEALHHAAREGDVRRVRALLRSGLSPNVVTGRRQTSRGTTAIFHAVAGGHLDVAEVLLAAGADLDRCDRRCRTPLNAACSQGRLEAAAWLVGHGAEIGHAYREPALYRCVGEVLSESEAEWLEETERRYNQLLPCRPGLALLRRLGWREEPPQPRPCPAELPRP